MKYKNIFIKLLLIISYIFSAILISIILAGMYFLNYNLNFNKYKEKYNDLSNSLLDLNLNKTINVNADIKNCNTKTHNCFCITNKCNVLNYNLIGVINSLNIKEISIDKDAKKVIFYFNKTFYSKNEYSLIYMKNGIKFSNSLNTPFYNKKYGGYIVDKILNNNWYINRPEYLKIFYLKLNQ